MQTNEEELIDLIVKDSIFAELAQSKRDLKLEEIETPVPIDTVEVLEVDTTAVVEPIDTIVSDTIAIDTVIASSEIDESLLPETINLINSQYDRFSIGVRGGFASNLTQLFNSNTLPLGYEARFDLQYAHYWPMKGNRGHVGLMLGASVGYMNVSRHEPWDETYEMVDEYGDILKYHVTADDIHEITQQIQVEVPLMFSLITYSGFYFNFGPRFLLPTLAQHNQTIYNGNIEVTDKGVGVVMLNNPVYGILPDKQLNFKCENDFAWNILVGIELGHEFKFKSGHSLGLGAYANWGVYGSYYLKGDKNLKSPITLTVPSSTTGVGTVEVKPLSESYTNNMGHLDAGIKLNFNFNFKK